MKNKYLFDSLVKTEIIYGVGSDSLFFSMFDVVREGILLSFLNSHYELKESLTDEFYYIAHNLFAYKGKKVIFKGSIATASRDEILLFFNQSNKNDDAREFLLSPVFTDKPKFVIYVAEGTYYIYKKDV
jgi:hypothetical protein